MEAAGFALLICNGCLARAFPSCVARSYINDVIFMLCMIRFEWDPAKANANERKHGVTFETALHVFNDPDALVDHDRIEGGEQRWQTLGLVGGVLHC